MPEERTTSAPKQDPSPAERQRIEDERRKDVMARDYKPNGLGGQNRKRVGDSF